MKKRMTPKQAERQDHRTNGKYAKTNACYQCGKSAGVEYFSDRRTDTTGANGEHFRDLGLILCKRCCAKSDGLDDAEAFVFLSAGANWVKS